jgi:hypothetical protein
MVQMYHLDVAKVDLNVACICKCSRCFHMYICKYFHLDVPMFCNGYTYAFKFFLGVLQVFQTLCCRYFSCFGRILQVFHLDVAKVDRMLHMLNGSMGPTCRSHLLQLLGRCRAGGRRPGGVGPTWAHQTSRHGKRGVGKRTSKRASVCPDVRALASP